MTTLHRYLLLLFAAVLAALAAGCAGTRLAAVGIAVDGNSLGGVAAVRSPALGEDLEARG